MSRRLIHLLWLGALAASTLLVYAPGLRGPYVLDDGENLTHNPAVAMKALTGHEIDRALMGNQSGPFGRPLASLSFALNYYFAGGFKDTLPFKLTNVAIHALNAMLVFWLALQLLRAPALRGRIPPGREPHVAGLAAALWALHPIQLTSVLYVVQRMNSLSGLFVLLGLNVYVQGRERLARASRGAAALMLGGITGGVLLGLGAKENAVLLPLFALTIEFALFREATPLAPAPRRALRGVTLAGFGLMAAIFLAYWTWHRGNFADAYAGRPFTPYQRVLTEARVLWYYVGLILLPNDHWLSLFHDDIAVSTGFWHPASTPVAVLGIIGAAAFAIRGARRWPVASFAVLWFLVGQSLESGVFGLEIAYEHRNYMPSFGIFFALAIGLTWLLHRTPRLARVGPAILGVLVLSLAFATFSRAATWSSLDRLAEHMIRYHPRSPRAADLAASVAVRERHDPLAAVRYLLQGLRAAPEEVGFAISLQISLSYLASNINARFARLHIPLAGRDIRIPSLPRAVRPVVRHGKVVLLLRGSGPAEINDLLRRRPITVYGVVVLEQLLHCLTHGTPYCQPLRRDALGWFVSATSNPRTSIHYRAMIASDTARLYAADGDYENALRYINFAAALAPGTIYYQLGQAEYLIRDGRLARARGMLAQLDRRRDDSRADRRTLATLRALLERAARRRLRSAPRPGNGPGGARRRMVYN